MPDLYSFGPLIVELARTKGAEQIPTGCIHFGSILKNAKFGSAATTHSRCANANVCLGIGYATELVDQHESQSVGGRSIAAADPIGFEDLGWCIWAGPVPMVIAYIQSFFAHCKSARLEQNNDKNADGSKKFNILLEIPICKAPYFHMSVSLRHT